MRLPVPDCLKELGVPRHTNKAIEEMRMKKLALLAAVVMAVMTFSAGAVVADTLAEIQTSDRATIS